jgi:glycosyltransferase involved in cell wall biosynthesis
MRVLALAPYPNLAPSTRYRLTQLVGPLAERGITLEIRPFLDDLGMRTLYDGAASTRALAVVRGLARRLRDLVSFGRFDVIVVQREAMLVGPPVVEWLIRSIVSTPLVLDIDDAIWLPEQSQVPTILSRLRRWPHKADKTIRRATLVTCGNHRLAEYVDRIGTRSHVVPNAVDVDYFKPADIASRTRERLVVGWIGSHSTYPYLEAIRPALTEVAETQPFTLRIIGARTSADASEPGVQFAPFDLEREARDFADLDIGLYPLPDDEWAAGKSGLKAIQYFAVGIPFVASPVGVVGEIGVPGSTHLTASTLAQWSRAVSELLADAPRREAMGRAGRRHAEVHHSLDIAADAFAAALNEAR